MEQFVAENAAGTPDIESGVTLEKKPYAKEIVSEVKAWGKILSGKFKHGKSKVKTTQKLQSKRGAKAMKTMQELKEQTK